MKPFNPGEFRSNQTQELRAIPKAKRKEALAKLQSSDEYVEAARWHAGQKKEIELNALLAGMHGFENIVSFGEALSRRKKDVHNERNEATIEAAFKENGLSIELSACPTRLNEYLPRFSVEDWAYIKDSMDPIVSLHVVSNYHKNYYERARYVWGQTDKDSVYPAPYIGTSIPATNARELSLLQSLPLIHGTTVANLEKILETGHIKTNREVYEMGGKDTATFLETSSQQTLGLDRELGLDRYVFADFGRPHPHHQQSEVTLVLDPALLQQKGAFVTQDDYADLLGEDDPLGLYVRTISATPYFYEEALARIRGTTIEEHKDGRSTYTVRNSVSAFANGQNSMPNNMGDVSFATWEVKIPRVPKEGIKKIIFKNQEEYDSFIKKYGDAIPAVYEPDLTPADSRINGEGNIANVLGLEGEHEKHYRAMTAGDYEDRMQNLEAVPKTARKIIYVDVSSAERKWIDEKTNPFTVSAFGSDVIPKPRPNPSDPVYLQLHKLHGWKREIAVVEVPQDTTKYSAGTPSKIIGIRTLTLDDFDVNDSGVFTFKGSDFL